MAIENIELPEENLYQNGVLYPLDSGDMWLRRTRLIIEPALEDGYHVVAEGDILTRIAWRYYKNFTLNSGVMWWVIADANRQIRNVTNLSDFVGQTLLIPNYSRIKNMIKNDQIISGSIR